MAVHHSDHAMAMKEKLLGEQRKMILSSSEVMERLAVAQGKVVADVGCGPGYFTLPLADAVSPGGNILAIDVSQEMLDALTERVREAGLANVTVVKSSDTDIPCPDGVADVVLTALVIHEVPRASRNAFLGELARIAGVLRKPTLLHLIEGLSICGLVSRGSRSQP